MRTLVATLLFWFAGQTPGLPQNVSQPGTIEGIVVRLGTGELLPGGRVGLTRVDGGATPYSTIVDSDGKFRFPNVEAGTYRVIATRDDGYLPTEYGQTAPNNRGLPITVGIGQSMKDIQISMPPPAAISGRIFDRNGQPMGHAQVQALKFFYKEGIRAQTIVESIQTNDLGEYRLFWLAPGPYIISARSDNLSARSVQAYIRRTEDQAIHDETSPPIVTQRILENGEILNEVQIPIYFPGTADIATATPVNIRAGDDVKGVDIAIKDLPPARKIRGRAVDGATGQPLAGATVRAFLRGTGPNVTVPTATADANGAFEIVGAISGSYDVFAIAAGTSGFPGGKNGHIEIEVSAKDLENVTVVAPPASNIKGRFTIDGSSNLDVTSLRISLSRAIDILGMPFASQPLRAGETDTSIPKTDGTFTLAGIGAGDYRIHPSYLPSRPLSFPANAYIKSIRLGNLDLLANIFHLEKEPEAQLEITIGMDPGTVTGSVVTDTLQPAANRIITLLPDSTLRSRTDLYKSTGSDSAGHFELKGIPPGDYKMFAWDEVENGAWFDPAFIQPYESRGTLVHVTGESTTNRQLTIITSGRDR